MKKILKTIRYFLVILLAGILVAMGINAADHYGNFSESIIGHLINGEPEDPCPSDMVFVPSSNGGFCIDKYEASPGPNCPHSNPSNQLETRLNLASAECRPVSVAGAVPWRFISQSQAAEACAKAGKRLPTPKEWYQAALGTLDKNLNWGPDDCHVSKNWPEQPGKTGTGKNCVSSAGAYDMIGNVWEWVDGSIDDGMYNNRELPSPGFIVSVDSDGIPIETNPDNPNENYYNDYFWIKKKGVRGMARGGYWDNKSDAGKYSLYLVSPPSFVGVGIGFRCAK